MLTLKNIKAYWTIKYIIYYQYPKFQKKTFNLVRLLFGKFKKNKRNNKILKDLSKYTNKISALQN